MEDPEENKVVVIPAKNEELTIGDVIKSVQQYTNDIILIDGQSSDRTREIAGSLGVRVIQDDGKGKGSALRLAIRSLNADILVFIDGDGSHNPADIPKLIAPIKNGEADLVVASRILGGSDEAMVTLEHLIRLMGSQLIAFTIAKIFRVGITDVENGFRAIKRAEFVDLGLRANDFTIEQEMVIRALRKGLQVREVASHECARKAGNSKLKTSQGWKFIIKFFSAVWF
jgi:dolichol-phosphate hexosyltransferase